MGSNYSNKPAVTEREHFACDTDASHIHLPPGTLTKERSAYFASRHYYYFGLNEKLTIRITTGVAAIHDPMFCRAKA